MARPPELARLIAQADRTRLSLAEIGIAPSGTSRSRAKEWHHFCVLAPGIQAIINFNFSADTRPAATPGATLARLIVLLHEGPSYGWDGDVETLPDRDVSVAAGQIDLRFGHNTATFRDGQYAISAALSSRPITLELKLQPLASPLLMRSDAPIGDGRINWLVLPRLLASGTIVSAGRVYTFTDAPAYHDHNWGSWLWGHDFAWEWGFGLPDQLANPWTLVFDHTTNRSRSRSLELTLALWQGPALVRIFTQRQVEAWPEGYLGDLPPKYPRVMSLLSPERTTEVPHRLNLRAQAGGDALEGYFEAQNIAQVIIPNETNLENTIINEVAGRICIGGQVKGQEVSLDGSAIFEFLTS